MSEGVAIYGTIHAFVHTVWKNLNGSPDYKRAFVVMWMIASDGYDINHHSVSWRDMRPNTFVHIWSTMDRLRTVIDPVTASWLLGTRGPVEYAETMGMPGPADVYLYPKETTTIPHIEVFSANNSRCTSTDLGTEYASLFDFRMSMMARPRREPMNVTRIMSNNMRAAMSMMNISNDRTDNDEPTPSR